MTPPRFFILFICALLTVPSTLAVAPGSPVSYVCMSATYAAKGTLVSGATSPSTCAVSTTLACGQINQLMMYDPDYMLRQRRIQVFVLFGFKKIVQMLKHLCSTKRHG